MVHYLKKYGNKASGDSIIKKKMVMGFTKVPKKLMTPISIGSLAFLFINQGKEENEWNLVVFLLLAFMAVTGEIQEKRAKKAIGFLHRQLQISVWALRNGTWLGVVKYE